MSKNPQRSQLGKSPRLGETLDQPSERDHSRSRSRDAELPRIYRAMANLRIYVLKLKGDEKTGPKYYVGKTVQTVQQRFKEHKNNKEIGRAAAQWCMKHGPPLEIVESTRPAPGYITETSITKEYMARFGIDNVRGASFSNQYINYHQRERLNQDIRQIRGQLDLCFQCGSYQHIASGCPIKNTNSITRKKQQVSKQSIIGKKQQVPNIRILEAPKQQVQSAAPVQQVSAKSEEAEFRKARKILKRFLDPKVVNRKQAWINYPFYTDIGLLDQVLYGYQIDKSDCQDNEQRWKVTEQMKKTLGVPICIFDVVVPYKGLIKEAWIITNKSRKGLTDEQIKTIIYSSFRPEIYEIQMEKLSQNLNPYSEAYQVGIEDE